MVWFKSEIDYARESLKQASETAIEKAGDKLSNVVQSGIKDASGELRDVVMNASREVDSKLDKISLELHNQRSFTKSDVRELVDYAAEKLGNTLDQRIGVMKHEITELMQERVEYLKQEVDDFFIRRQQDLARERRRLIANIAIAVVASVAVGILSLAYQRYAAGTLNLFGLFRIIFLSLAGGYAAFVIVGIVRRYLSMSEHRKDLLFLFMRYWGALRPASLFIHLLLVVVLMIVLALLFLPEQVADLVGSDTLREWVRIMKGQ